MLLVPGLCSTVFFCVSGGVEFGVGGVGVDVEGVDWEVEVASPEDGLVLVEVVQVLCVFAVGFSELVVSAVKLVVCSVWTFLWLLVNGDLVLVCTVEDTAYESRILVAIKFGFDGGEVLPLLEVGAHLTLVRVDLVLLWVLRGHCEFSEIYGTFIEIVLHPSLSFIYKTDSWILMLIYLIYVNYEVNTFNEAIWLF